MQFFGRTERALCVPHWRRSISLFIIASLNTEHRSRHQHRSYKFPPSISSQVHFLDNRTRQVRFSREQTLVAPAGQARCFLSATPSGSAKPSTELFRGRIFGAEVCGVTRIQKLWPRGGGSSARDHGKRLQGQRDRIRRPLQPLK